MKPRFTFLTLGVNDLDAAVHYYRDGLGLNTEGLVGEKFEFACSSFTDREIADFYEFLRATHGLESSTAGAPGSMDRP